MGEYCANHALGEVLGVGCLGESVIRYAVVVVEVVEVRVTHF